MQTKDLRYTSAEYTREHQRTYTVLDINAGDSTTVVVNPVMRYADALRAYDITTTDSALVTDAVSKWILTGESIWDSLEHLRLQIRTVDSQRIALPDGFVGRVLITRVTPNADAEAPELIRLGALLHRIQQEPTALYPWKDKVHTVTEYKPEPEPEPNIYDYGYSSEPQPPDYYTSPPRGTFIERSISAGSVTWKSRGTASTAELQALGYKQDRYDHWYAIAPITKLVADSDAPPYHKGQFIQYVDAKGSAVAWLKAQNTSTLNWEGYWILKHLR